MTLRTRLTIAFLVVVLGPVLLGAAFVSGTVNAVGQDRATHRLELAAAAVQTAVGTLCQQLQTTAEAVATQTHQDQADGHALARDLTFRGRASMVLIHNADDAPHLQVGDAAEPWADCAGSDPTSTQQYGAVAARVQLRDADGLHAGEVWAAQRLDSTLLQRLSEAAGVRVQPLAGGSDPTIGDPTTQDDVLAAAAAELADGESEQVADGQWLRRVDPAEAQPLPLLLTTPASNTQGLHAVLFTVVVGAGLLAIVAAWWLARSTTRPLAELARAADQAAAGDFTVRVPVRANDEAGQMAAAFNRMTHRTNSYMQALTASRDQLRGHLAVLGDTLSSTHDLHRILQVILQTAVAATGARAGAVMLLDQSGDSLSGHRADAAVTSTDPAVTSTDPAVTDADPAVTDEEGAVAGDEQQPPADTLTVPLAGSLLGSVVASGKARRGRIGSGDDRLHPDEPACETYVAVPITAPLDRSGQAPPWPTPIGVSGALVLYDRVGGDEFDETDLETLRTFAGQAAVAVDNVRTHEEAQRLSLTDPLTGLWNYRYLTDALRREVERASRFGHTLTVLAMDLDRFKDVNDVYGHPAGDSVLAEFARRIRFEVREVDLAFRQGGEEFVVLLPETDANGGATVAQRLGVALRERPITITSRSGTDAQTLSIAVTVSIGIAVYPDHGLTPPAVLDAADDALYAAKAAGRDTYRMASTAPEPVVASELSVRAGATTPQGDLPQAGGEQPQQANRGAQPPRQTRGR